MFLRGTVFNSTNTDCACAHYRRCDSNRDYNQLLDGWHDHLRSADDCHHLVLLTASTERELAHSNSGKLADSCGYAAAPLHDGLAP